MVTSKEDCIKEHYIRQLYVPSTQLRSIQEVRWLLFSKKQYTDEQLPPTEAARHQMSRRANYVMSDLFGSPVTPHIQTYPTPHTLPSPTLHGWKNDGGELQAIPTTLPVAPKAVLQLIKCGCKGMCTTMICSCRKHNLTCTDICASCESKL